MQLNRVISEEKPIKMLHKHQIKVKSSEQTLNLKSAKSQACEFMKALATAHECMVDMNTIKKGIIQYQGLSPDEVTLVEVAQKHGYEMLD